MSGLRAFSSLSVLLIIASLAACAGEAGDDAPPCDVLSGCCRGQTLDALEPVAELRVEALDEGSRVALRIEAEREVAVVLEAGEEGAGYTHAELADAVEGATLSGGARLLARVSGTREVEVDGASARDGHLLLVRVAPDEGEVSVRVWAPPSDAAGDAAGDAARACSHTVALEPFEARAGNGILELTEACDDGNSAAGDGCHEGEVEAMQCVEGAPGPVMMWRCEGAPTRCVQEACDAASEPACGQRVEVTAWTLEQGRREAGVPTLALELPSGLGVCACEETALASGCGEGCAFELAVDRCEEVAASVAGTPQPVGWRGLCEAPDKRARCLLDMSGLVEDIVATPDVTTTRRRGLWASRARDDSGLRLAVESAQRVQALAPSAAAGGWWVASLAPDDATTTRRPPPQGWTLAGWLAGDEPGTVATMAGRVRVERLTLDGLGSPSFTLGETRDDVLPLAIVAAPEGDVFLAASFRGAFVLGDVRVEQRLDDVDSPGARDLLVARLGAQGEVRWVHTMGQEIALDAAGAWLAPTTGDAVAVAVVSRPEVHQPVAQSLIYQVEGGALAWSALLVSEGRAEVSALVRSADGALHAAGVSEGALRLDGLIAEASSGASCGFIASLSADGAATRLERRCGAPVHRGMPAALVSLATDGEGGLYYHGPETDAEDAGMEMAVVALDGAGEVRWRAAADANADSAHLTRSEEGALYLTRGVSSYRWGRGGGPLTSRLDPASGAALWTTRVDLIDGDAVRYTTLRGVAATGQGLAIARTSVYTPLQGGPLHAYIEAPGELLVLRP